MFSLFKNLRDKMASPVHGITWMSTKATDATPAPPIAEAQGTAAEFSARTNQWRPSNFERKILVWTGKYKTAEEIPNLVAQDVIEKAKNRFRIRVSNYSIAFTCVACVVLAILGKRASERGESVAKMNLDWHKKINQEAAETTAAEKK